MDFNAVAKGAGISLSGNAWVSTQEYARVLTKLCSSRKFQQISAKFGFRYDKSQGGLIRLEDGDGTVTPAKKPSTPSKRKAASKQKEVGGATVKKVKLEDDNEDKDESAENDIPTETAAN